jgi:uncharacterized membrane protein YkoI
MNVKTIMIPGVAGLAALVGYASSSAINAVSTSALSVSTNNTSTFDTKDENQSGHTANGKTESLLTGDAATKAKAAAETAVPGGTVQRVENDAEGATYEAHVKKSDGTEVTVKMDANFKVTGVETGHGSSGKSHND